MFSKWIDEYKHLSEKMRFFSRLSSFLLSVLSVFSLSWVFWWTWQLKIELDEDVLTSFIVGVAFHLIVLILFATRFVLSFLKSQKSAKFSQISWFVGFLTITSYCLYSLNSNLEFRKIFIGAPPLSSLNWADNTFSLFCWLYLISCVIQFFVLSLISFVKFTKNK